MFHGNAPDPRIALAGQTCPGFTQFAVPFLLCGTGGAASMPGRLFERDGTRVCGVNVKLTTSFALSRISGSVCALQAASLFSRGTAADTQVAKNNSDIVRGGVGNARAKRKRPDDIKGRRSRLPFFVCGDTVALAPTIQSRLSASHDPRSGMSSCKFPKFPHLRRANQS